MHVFFYFSFFFFFSKLIWRVQSDITCHYTRNFMSSWQPYNKISTVHVLEIKFNLFSVFVIYFCDLFVCLFACFLFFLSWMGTQKNNFSTCYHYTRCHGQGVPLVEEDQTESRFRKRAKHPHLEP